ncbi:MAG TPA: DMT family transporter [bacterium]|nr:DMT family transporter [bacterium]HPQ66847.1 DMT family transporter [bacterium]
MSDRARGAVLLIVANFCFACGYSLAHAAAGKISPWHLLFCRCLVYLLVLVPWACFHPRQARGRNRGALILRGVFGTAMLGCVVSALALIPLSTATVLAKTTPFWAVFVLWIAFSVRPTAVEFVAVPVALVGIFLVVHPEGSQSLANLAPLGLFLALGAGLLNSIEFIILRRLRRTDVPHTINLWYSGVMLAAMLPLAVFLPWPAHPRFWLLAVAFGASTLIGQTLLATALHLVKPSEAAICTPLIPTFATVIGWVVFGQTLSFLEILGLVLVIGAGTAAIAAGSRRPLPG